MNEKTGYEKIWDAARGLAVFTMFCANLAGNILPQPHPFALRLYGTFAAPFFVLIAGMFFRASLEKKDRGWKNYLLKAGVIFSIAALLDLDYGDYPFINMDVLYLLGFSFVFAYPLCRNNRRGYYAWIPIFAAGWYLQNYVNYRLDPVSLELDQPFFEFWKAQAGGVAYQWFVDGYFPILPWFGIFLLGAHLRSLRASLFSQHTAGTLSVAALLVLSAILWYLFPGAMHIRENYSEMFYPPTMGFILTSGFLLILIVRLLKPVSDKNLILSFWSVYGRNSLLLYALHYPIITHLIAPAWNNAEGDPGAGWPEFLGSYAYLCVALYLIGRGLDFWKTKESFQKIPESARFLFGH